jgi:hypothetical protein
MRGLCTLMLVSGLAGACAPYEAMPTSPYQWQRRQEQIERREAERLRQCATMNKDTDRYRRDCVRAGDSDA